MNDPYLILGVSEDADDAAVEAAYRGAIRQCPPERDPQEFEALRGAFEKIRTRRDRLAYGLFDRTPPSIEDLLERAAPAGEPRRPERAVIEALLRRGG
jgi:curved DNA-binding protein CbpA